MHSLAYQQGNKFSPTAMIYQNRREPDSTALNLDGIRAAVRAWAADCRSREFVAALIVEEWRATGGTGLDIPTDSHRQMQKVFRWIDGDTEYAANNIRQLAPAIMAVLPLEYLTPGMVQIYRKSKGIDGAANWEKFDEWTTSRKDITLVTLYTKRTGFMCGSPPLLNMALLNIKHWQSQSEQDNILHVARVPLLTVFGLEEGQELIIGSSSATSFTDRQKQGLEYVEHTGSSIGAGKESLAELVEQMRQAGAKLLRTENTSTKSVDQTSEEKMQEQSPLYTMATSLEDAIDNILQIMAEYIGEKDGGNVDVRTELDVESTVFNPSAALAIQALRQGGDIRRADAIKSLQKLNIIDADADPDVVLSELLAESASLTEPPPGEV